MECLKTEIKKIIQFIGKKRHKNINLFLVPHHGAKTSFSKFYYCNAVICFGLNNRFGHPDQATLRDLALSARCVHFINENNCFYYTIS